MSFFKSFFGSNEGTGGQTSNNPGATNTPTVTPAPTPTPTPAPTASPLDTFAKIWDTPSTPPQADPTIAGTIFAKADKSEMLKAARNVDFAKNVPADLVAKIAAGGPEAAQALMQVINDVGQQAYAAAAFASTQITDRGLATFNEGLQQRLPSQLKKHSVSESLRTDNPALNHPAVTPLISALEIQFSQQFPTASAAEITASVKNYLNSVGGILSGKPTGTENANTNGASGQASTDWEKFLA